MVLVERQYRDLVVLTFDSFESSGELAASLAIESVTSLVSIVLVAMSSVLLKTLSGWSEKSFDFVFSSGILEGKDSLLDPSWYYRYSASQTSSRHLVMTTHVSMKGSSSLLHTTKTV